MSIRYHRKVKTNTGGHINISKSGISHSQKVGKFTFNSRGMMSFNSSVKGLSLRFPTIFGVFVFIPLYYGFKGVLFLFIKLPIRIMKDLLNKVLGLFQRNRV